VPQPSRASRTQTDQRRDRHARAVDRRGSATGRRRTSPKAGSSASPTPWPNAHAARGQKPERAEAWIAGTSADIPKQLDGGADLVLQVHNHISALTRRNIDTVGAEWNIRGVAPGLLRGEIERDTVAADFGAAGGDKVTEHFTIPAAVDVIAINPHAQYVCKEMYGYAVLCDGSRRTLIRIPDWNFDWHSSTSTSPRFACRRYARGDGIHLRQFRGEPAQPQPAARARRMGPGQQE